MRQTNALDFSFFPIVLLACIDLQSHCKFLHHGSVVACVVTSDMTNLYSDEY